MTNPEFNNNFDVLYNNITSNLAPELDLFEKSFFLTKALDEILKAYVTPKGNKFLEGYDDSAKRLIDFIRLTKVATINTFSNPLYDYHSNSKSVTLSSDLKIVAVINETAKVLRNGKETILQVVPIGFDEYNRLLSKPYKRPLKNHAWKLLSSDVTPHADIIVGPSDILKEYKLRYVTRPKPIVLTTFDESEGLSIDGYRTYQECELDEAIHHEILQRAVELAKAAYIGNIEASSNLSALIALGLSSATNIGIVNTQSNKG